MATGAAAVAARAGMTADAFELGIELRDFTMHAVSGWILQRTLASPVLEAITPAGVTLTVDLRRYPNGAWTSPTGPAGEVLPIEVFPFAGRLLVRWVDGPAPAAGTGSGRPPATAESAPPTSGAAPRVDLIDLPLPTGSARGITVAPGRVLVACDTDAGTDGAIGCVVRLATRPGGDTFGDDAGRAAFSLASGDTGLTCIAASPTGEVIVGGFAVDADGTTRGALGRLTPAGVLDRTFGNGAPVLVGPSPGRVEEVRVDRDGRILVVVSERTEAGDDVGELRLLDAAGRPVAGFGGARDRAVLDSAYSPAWCTALAGDPASPIVHLGGRTGRRGAGSAIVATLDGAGAPSSRFGRAGVVAGLFGGRGAVEGLTLVAATAGRGLLLAAGYGEDPRSGKRIPMLAMMDAGTGAPVDGFGDGGLVVLPRDGDAGFVGVVPQPDGNLLAVGNDGAGPGCRALLVELGPRGRPTGTFGPHGVGVVAAGDATRVAAVAAPPGGGLLAAATVTTGGRDRPAVLRVDR